MDEADFRTVVADVWRMIFKKLGTKTRLECKLLCEEFYDVLFHDFAFKQDRRLIMDYCYLHASHPHVLALTESTTKFEHLKIGSIDVDPQANLDEFWEMVGYTITECEYDFLPNNSFVFKALTIHFPVLTELHITNFDSFLRWFGDNQEPDWALNSVQLFSGKGRTLPALQLEKFLALMPNVKDIELDWFSGDDDELLKVLSANAGKIRRLNGSEALLPVVACTNLRHMTVFDLPQDSLLMQNLVKYHNNLKSLAVYDAKIPTQGRELIQELRIGITSPGYPRFFADLEQLTELKSLSLVINTPFCFSDHRMTNIRAKKISWSICKDCCVNCFKFFYFSLALHPDIYSKNLKQFTAEGFWTKDQLEILSHLQSRCSQWYELDGVEASGANNLAHCPNLKALSIVVGIEEEMWRWCYVLAKLVKLRKFTILSRATRSVLEILQIAGNFFTELEAITIQKSTISDISLQHLLEFGSPNIQHITLSAKLIRGWREPREPFDQLLLLFQKYHRLQTLNIHGVCISRIDIEKHYAATESQDVGSSILALTLMKKLLSVVKK